MKQNLTSAVGNYSVSAVQNRPSLLGRLLLLLGLFVASFAARAQTAAPATLDLSQFTRDAGQDFTTAKGFDSKFASNVYGHDFWFSGSSKGLLISSAQSTGWKQSGFMQIDKSPAAGFGYGLFHFQASIPSDQTKQGGGVNLILWNADDSWTSPENGDKIDEVDLLEAYGTQGVATYHFYDANLSNHLGQRNIAIKDQNNNYIDLTKQHDYDVLWQPGLMAMYVDGKLLWSVTGEKVPADYAHGGKNKTIGAQVVIPRNNDGKVAIAEPLPTVQLWVQNAFHYVLSGSLSTPPATTYAGRYVLKDRNSGLILDVSGSSTANGAKVQQWKANGTSAQTWTVEAVGDGYYKLLAECSGKALDVSDISLDKGAVVHQWEYVGGKNQQWKIADAGEGYVTLQARHSGYLLDVSGASINQGATIIQWLATSGSKSQQWELEPVSAAATATAKTAVTASLVSSEKDSFSAYPNPNHGQVNLTLIAQQAQSVTVYVNNAQGVLITSLTVSAQAGRTELSLPGTLPVGTYFLQVTIDGHKQLFTLKVE